MISPGPRPPHSRLAAAARPDEDHELAAPCLTSSASSSTKVPLGTSSHQVSSARWKPMEHPSRTGTSAAKSTRRLPQHLATRSAPRSATSACTGSRSHGQTAVALGFSTTATTPSRTAYLQVVTLRYVVGYMSLKLAPTLYNTVSKTSASSVLGLVDDEASWSDRPQCGGQRIAPPAGPWASIFVDDVAARHRAEGVEDRLRPRLHLLRLAAGQARAPGRRRRTRSGRPRPSWRRRRSVLASSPAQRASAHLPVPARPPGVMMPISGSSSRSRVSAWPSRATTQPERLAVADEARPACPA